MAGTGFYHTKKMNYIYLINNFFENLFFKFKLMSNYFRNHTGSGSEYGSDPKLSESRIWIRIRDQIRNKSFRIHNTAYLTALSPTAITSAEFRSVTKLFTIALGERKKTRFKHERRIKKHCGHRVPYTMSIF
jgi:hypothetical protein